MFSTIKAFAKTGFTRFNESRNVNLQSTTVAGFGIQFSLTPSIIKTSFFPALYVNVKGKGPANRLASFQSANGELPGNATTLSVVSIVIAKFDFRDRISFRLPAPACSMSVIL